jgi:hypothetical protein
MLAALSGPAAVLAAATGVTPRRLGQPRCHRSQPSFALYRLPPAAAPAHLPPRAITPILAARVVLSAATTLITLALEHARRAPREAAAAPEPRSARQPLHHPRTPGRTGRDPQQPPGTRPGITDTGSSRNSDAPRPPQEIVIFNGCRTASQPGTRRTPQRTGQSPAARHAAGRNRADRDAEPRRPGEVNPQRPGPHSRAGRLTLWRQHHLRTEQRSSVPPGRGTTATGIQRIVDMRVIQKGLRCPRAWAGRAAAFGRLDLVKCPASWPVSSAIWRSLALAAWSAAGPASRLRRGCRVRSSGGPGRWPCRCRPG